MLLKINESPGKDRKESFDGGGQTHLHEKGRRERRGTYPSAWELLGRLRWKGGYAAFAVVGFVSRDEP